MKEEEIRITVFFASTFCFLRGGCTYSPHLDIIKLRSHIQHSTCNHLSCGLAALLKNVKRWVDGKDEGRRERRREDRRKEQMNEGWKVRREGEGIEHKIHRNIT